MTIASLPDQKVYLYFASKYADPKKHQPVKSHRLMLDIIFVLGYCGGWLYLLLAFATNLVIHPIRLQMLDELAL
jgi:hypothetical protein